MAITLNGTTGITTPALDNNGNLDVDGGTIKLDGNYPIGTRNVALGDAALDSNSTGSYNVAIGNSALTTTTAGQYNVAVGDFALSASTSNFNTAIGQASILSGTTGAQNTAVGQGSLQNTTTGSNNVAVGRSSLNSNTTASNNTAIGHSALTANTTGANNTACGLENLDELTTGSYNTAIGNRCGASLTTGSTNILIGNAANVSSSGASNEIVMGNSATGKGNNTAFIAPNGGGCFQSNNASTWSTTSDERLKKNIVDNTDGLDKINAIQVRNFEYRTEDEITELDPSNVIEIEGTQIGVIAQEIQQVCPEMVKEESKGVLTVDTDNLVWYLINAVKELSAKVEALESN